MAKKKFTYVIDLSTSLADAGVKPETLAIDSGSDFELHEIRTTGTAGMKVQIAAVSGDNLSNSPIDSGLVGAGQNGDVLREPVLLPKGSQYTVTFTNNSGGTITKFQVALMGLKVVI